MSGRGGALRGFAVVVALVAAPAAAWAQPTQRAGAAAGPAAGPRPPAVQPAMPRAQVDALLGPLRLVRPLAPETLERLLDEGESVYRARNLPQAFEAFGTVVELEPRSVHAWLRLGNLHQQAGRDPEALHAYRQAGRGVPRSARDDAARGKALLNVAMLGIAQAEEALEAFDREHDPDDAEANPDATASARDEAAWRLAELQRRADRHGELPPPPARRAPARADGARAADRAAPVSGAAGPDDAAGRTRHDPWAARRARVDAPEEEAFEPYTVDRWTGRARRPGVRPAPARGALVEPVTASPLPAAPAVDVLRGVVPGRARP